MKLTVAQMQMKFANVVYFVNSEEPDEGPRFFIEDSTLSVTRQVFDDLFGGYLWPVSKGEYTDSASKAFLHNRFHRFKRIIYSHEGSREFP